MNVTRSQTPPVEPRIHCRAMTEHAAYQAEQLAHGDWLYTVSVLGDHLSLFARCPEVLAEPYASELRAFKAACEGV